MVDETACLDIKTGDGSKHGQIGMIGAYELHPPPYRSLLLSFLSLITFVKCYYVVVSSYLSCNTEDSISSVPLVSK